MLKQICLSWLFIYIYIFLSEQKNILLMGVELIVVDDDDDDKLKASCA